MEALVWTLIVLGVLATAACAVHLTRSQRRDAAHLGRSIHRTAPVLLAASLLPLPALLAADASAAAWGLWGATTITAALVYAYADTLGDLPPHAWTASRPGSGP
ncbi:hypothetical protein GCM10018777_10780 [Streptomyces albogriseolus]|uniref:hypothetical protein n=1 Tax=Streptomyces albogriseolus TaxID=1887 RepID=UPI0016733CD2|nr:hypothetical protein [Streptomyces viridodiastaticus]MCX4570677.1 hypothetical protein [Streptomyces viridodiastaticus]GHG01922.1 hypothetical protein GCM10018777_10780 [Streptomyces viridodiastaticus]